MSYDISFKVKVEGIDEYVIVGNCTANTTWNARDMICKSTGLKWKNCDNNGLCSDVIPKIEHGISELTKYPEKYKKYNAKNGWGTVEGTKNFFREIICAWEDFSKYNKQVASVATFWIE